MTDDDFQQNEGRRLERRGFISGGALLLVYLVGGMALAGFLLTVTLK
jgi:hypothetical protein